MRDKQLDLDACAIYTSEIAPPEPRIDQDGHDATAAMISAVVGAIPMVGGINGQTGLAHRYLGVTTAPWGMYDTQRPQRPAAYLYACRDRLGMDDSQHAISICSNVTGWTTEALSTIDGGTRQVWLRMNGERPDAMDGRIPARIMGGQPERDGYVWALNIAKRCPAAWRTAFKVAQEELFTLDPLMLGTLAGWLLILRWSAALRFVVRWRLEGRNLGEDMLVRRDLAVSLGEVPECTLVETYQLATRTPATSMLARAIMSVAPRGDS